MNHIDDRFPNKWDLFQVDDPHALRYLIGSWSYLSDDTRLAIIATFRADSGGRVITRPANVVDAIKRALTLIAADDSANDQLAEEIKASASI